MVETDAAPRSLMLVLHDVAPETWPDYQPFVQAVERLGNVPMTWLVVPDFHHRNPCPTRRPSAACSNDAWHRATSWPCTAISMLMMGPAAQRPRVLHAPNLHP